jgi:hypothetical protein
MFADYHRSGGSAAWWWRISVPRKLNPVIILRKFNQYPECP